MYGRVWFQLVKCIRDSKLGLGYDYSLVRGETTALFLWGQITSLLMGMIPVTADYSTKTATATES